MLRSLSRTWYGFTARRNGTVYVQAYVTRLDAGIAVLAYSQQFGSESITVGEVRAWTRSGALRALQQVANPA